MKPERVLFGIGLIACGYVFIMPLSYMSMFLGMMIAGFGIVPSASEFQEETSGTRESKESKVYETVPPKKTALEAPSAASKKSSKAPRTRKKSVAG